MASMIGFAHTITFDAWVAKFEDKPLRFLTDQQSPWIRGYNGEAFDAAIAHLIAVRKAERDGTQRKRPRTSYVVEQPDEEDDDRYVTRHIKNGPKGATVRVRVPRTLDSGD